jgi:asparagine synthase (glutamine-hydrolysing)
MAASSTAPPWPLAWWAGSGTVVVSSNLVSMLRCPEVPRALNESYLVHLVLGLSAMTGGSTALRGIRRLCPGEALIVDSEGARVARVDRLEPRRLQGDAAELGHLFRDELQRGVGRALDGGKAVISLSGGLDSAAVAAVGLRCVHELPALSFAAPDLDPSAELDSVGTMERAWPTLRVTHLDASEVELPDFGGDLRDDPLLTPLALVPARLLLWGRAKDAAYRTVVEGEGGDELFSMLPTPLDALRRGHFVSAVRQTFTATDRRRLVEHGLLLPMLPARVRRAWMARREPIEACLPAFAKWNVGEHSLVREAATELIATFVHRPFETRLNDWLAAPTFVGAGLSRRHLAAGFGLSLEWPMLDRGVLELVLGLHAANVVGRGPQKPFLRAALAGLVPDAVRLAPKNVGLYTAFIPRVLTSPRSRASLRDSRVRARLADLVRLERVETMLDGLAEGRVLTTSTLWQLECVVSFAEWYSRASREYGVD